MKERDLVVTESIRVPTKIKMGTPAASPLLSLEGYATGELSIDARCAALEGRCEPDLAPQVCWIDGVCRKESESGPDGSPCVPTRDAFAWTIAPTAASTPTPEASPP